MTQTKIRFAIPDLYDQIIAPISGTVVGIVPAVNKNRGKTYKVREDVTGKIHEFKGREITKKRERSVR
jgi:hypothetical protein